MSELKILFVTSEMAPLIKTGGLADVSGALPGALRRIGVDTRVLLPGYPQVLDQLGPHEVVARFDHLGGFPASRLLFTILSSGVPLMVLDCPGLYRREGGPYLDKTGSDWWDNSDRFGLLSKVAAVLGSQDSPLSWHPELVNCNDWQTGLTPAYLHFEQNAVPSVMTIHNLAFQGSFPAENVETLGLPASCFGVNGLELYGQMSFLKAGLFYSNYITTVSPNYAHEIQQEPLGFGLQGLLRGRTSQLCGILNGIDIDDWNPETDKKLVKNYSVTRFADKAVNKAAVQSKMGLDINPDIPLIGVVGRFTHQKGLDVLLDIAPELINEPAQLVMLGSGDWHMQQKARDLSHYFPGKIGVMVGFDEALSRQIEAGADMFAMPSRFEPCGLNQFYSQCYGTPPIVHATGGLVDSVVDCSEETLRDGSASGFLFKGMSNENLLATLRRAIALYHDKTKWQTLCKMCMSKDFSWESSARSYREVYLQVLNECGRRHDQ